LDSQGLVALLATLTNTWQTKAYGYIERLTGIKLSQADAAWGRTLTQDPARLGLVGRVFCADREIRWQGTDAPTDAYQVQILAEERQTLDNDVWAYQTFPEVGQIETSYLWGERKEEAHETWAEARIRDQRYPVPWSEEKTMALARTCTYGRGGIIQVTRWLDLKAASRPKEA
jgi:hypothetical protein